MEIKINCRNIAAPVELQEHTEKKFEKLHKFAPNINYVEVIINKQKLVHTVEAIIHNKKQLIALKEDHESIYSALDKIIDHASRMIKEKADRQKLNKKEKMVSHLEE
jgi:ribosomal subunit interface protein